MIIIHKKGRDHKFNAHHLIGYKKNEEKVSLKHCILSMIKEVATNIEYCNIHDNKHTQNLNYDYNVQ